MHCLPAIITSTHSTTLTLTAHSAREYCRQAISNMYVRKPVEQDICNSLTLWWYCSVEKAGQRWQNKNSIKVFRHVAVRPLISFIDLHYSPRSPKMNTLSSPHLTVAVTSPLSTHFLLSRFTMPQKKKKKKCRVDTIPVGQFWQEVSDAWLGLNI